jgi:hypothetical protein
MQVSGSRLESSCSLCPVHCVRPRVVSSLPEKCLRWMLHASGGNTGHCHPCHEGHDGLWLCRLCGCWAVCVCTCACMCAGILLSFMCAESCCLCVSVMFFFPVLGPFLLCFRKPCNVLLKTLFRLLVTLHWLGFQRIDIK